MIPAVLTQDGFGIPRRALTEEQAAALKSEEALREEDEAAAAEEFERVHPLWIGLQDPWPKDGPDVEALIGLVNNDIGEKYRLLQTEEKKDPGMLGYLLPMCLASRGQIGALLSESYAERIFSCANGIVTDKRTRMRSELINMFIVLRMNREWMKEQRKKRSMEMHANTASLYDPLVSESAEARAEMDAHELLQLPPWGF